ncbi:hypothetical protein RHSIM_Rhsim06G0125400 [Rhododendron simsii]|uniref:Uncharacterized protein n=1 Tax=Rhododendron simsii TaxID=118357 RepID=A0A834H3V6_RHOSS|nr:hypothetical protein RHSIM_Rhsim06G0125400 [Rhododendron simsii]
MEEVGKLVVQPCEKCASCMVVSGQRRHSGRWFMLHRGQSIYQSHTSVCLAYFLCGYHHEVVADLLQTSFLFSIPMGGPMSFSTPRISVQWALHFEFFTTPKNVDWTRYDTLMRPHMELTCGKVSQVCV